jgi:hypothetical protein
MNTPIIYYLNLGFTWLLVLMSIWGYTTIRRKTGEKMAFWLFLGTGWGLLGISHILTLGGIPSDAWFMTVLRCGGYIFHVLSVLSLMIHIVNRDVML